MCFLSDNMRFHKNFVSGVFCFFFSFLAHSDKNISQWFSNVAQMNLFIFLLENKTVIKMYYIQITANDFNGFNILFS